MQRREAGSPGYHSGGAILRGIIVTKLFEPLSLARGPAMKNRFVLAPLTNLQSHTDGTLSDDEYRWLTMRARVLFEIIDGIRARCHWVSIHSGPGGRGASALAVTYGQPSRSTSRWAAVVLPTCRGPTMTRMSGG